jgi:hypothetical protein
MSAVATIFVARDRPSVAAVRWFTTVSRESTPIDTGIKTARDVAWNQMSRT